MNTLTTLTEEEVYQIASLTVRGWTLSGSTWSKTGKTQKVWASPPGCKCGSCSEQVDSEEFTREQAFWEGD